MNRIHSLVAFACLGTFVYACASSNDPGEAVGATGGEVITGAQIVARGGEWVAAKLQYCQSPNHAHDSDPSCASTCNRLSNAQWDPYRSDCSGFVSWSWGLGAPGLDTSGFAPASTAVSHTINGSDLQPGDALNIPGEHIILFVSWQTKGSVANFYEEPGCSSSKPYAKEFSSSVSITGDKVHVSYEGKTFYAIRFTGVSSAGDAGSSVSSNPGTGKSSSTNKPAHGASSSKGSGTGSSSRAGSSTSSDNDAGDGSDGGSGSGSGDYDGGGSGSGSGDYDGGGSGSGSGDYDGGGSGSGSEGSGSGSGGEGSGSGSGGEGSGSGSGGDGTGYGSGDDGSSGYGSGDDGSSGYGSGDDGSSGYGSGYVDENDNPRRQPAPSDSHSLRGT